MANIRFLLFFLIILGYIPTVNAFEIDQMDISVESTGAAIMSVKYSLDNGDKAQLMAIQYDDEKYAKIEKKITTKIPSDKTVEILPQTDHSNSVIWLKINGFALVNLNEDGSRASYSTIPLVFTQGENMKLVNIEFPDNHKETFRDTSELRAIQYTADNVITDFEIIDIYTDLDKTPDDIMMYYGINPANPYGEELGGTVPENSLAVYEAESFHVVVKIKILSGNSNSIKVVLIPSSIYTGIYNIERVVEPHGIEEGEIGAWKFKVDCIKGIIKTDWTSHDMSESMSRGDMANKPEIYKFRAIAYTEKSKTTKSSKPIMSFYDKSISKKTRDTASDEAMGVATLGLYSILKIEGASLDALSLLYNPVNFGANSAKLVESAENEVSKDLDKQDLDKLYTSETRRLDSASQGNESPGFTGLFMVLILIIVTINLKLKDRLHCGYQLNKGK